VTTAGAVRCFGSNSSVHNLAPTTATAASSATARSGTSRSRCAPDGRGPASIAPTCDSKHAGGGYAGNHIYNTSGANQTKATAMAPGGTRHFFVRVQNDAHVADSFFLVGSRSGHGFVISYSSGGKNIRSSVTSGQYWVSVPAGATRTVVVTVRAKKSTPHGVSSSLKVVVRSAGDSAKADAVKGVFKTT
jgi:hypothetical protein